jgi:hypothetical protein
MHKECSDHRSLPLEFFLAPIHPATETTPLRVAVVGRRDAAPNEDPLVLLREAPGSRVYLGAVCDAAARVLLWLELSVQTAGPRHSALANLNHCFTNRELDLLWQQEIPAYDTPWPEDSIVLGLEQNHPGPILVKRTTLHTYPRFVETVVSRLRLCQDDALLARAGLPAYSSSLARYLHDPQAASAPRFWAATPDIPAHPAVEPFDAIAKETDGAHVFNAHAGLIRARRLAPLPLEDYLDVLEGENWTGFRTGNTSLFVGHEYEQLRLWSGNRENESCLLHGLGQLADRLAEILFLKLGLLLDMFEVVREHACFRRSPLLNLSPASFRLSLSDAGGHFPLLWSAKAHLVKPGQAHALKVAGSDTPYFVRMGELNPSPFMPEGLNAHSFGMGSVLLRQVLEENDGTVIEGTLRTTEYVMAAPDDLVWLQLPLLASERIECYARSFTTETTNRREIRFRTLPRPFPPTILEALQRHSGATLARAPYEVWPVLSTPCDLFSLAVIGLRALLANRVTNLPVLLDDILSLSRTLPAVAASEFRATLSARLRADPDLVTAIGPHWLAGGPLASEQAMAAMPIELWADTVIWLMRLFPGAPGLSYCQSMCDVSPLAPETAFDAPIQDLRKLVLRARSLVLPGVSAHTDIVQVLRDAINRE